MGGMVAMNSIPQQEVARVMAKVNWREPYLQHHLELWRKILLQQHLLAAHFFMLELLIVLYFELENLNHEPYKLIQCL
jgi:hypothetical protein